MLCALLLQIVLNLCGRRLATAWFAAVAILGLLFCPDREAAGVFLFLGEYPIVKQMLDGRKLSGLWKALYFNFSVLVLYWWLLFVMGIPGLYEEFQELGSIMLVILVLLGNGTFFLLDRVLEKPFFQKLGRYGH